MKLRFLKSAAWFVVITFTLTSLNPVSFASTPEVSSIPFKTLEIPAEFGQVTDIFQGATGAPAFIHIQSAHGNYQAEKNIESILGHIEKNSSVKLMLLEGASEKLQPELFRMFPKHPDFNRKVTDKLVAEGYLTGPERFLIENSGERGTGNASVSRSPRDVSRAAGMAAFGIEDLEAYKKDRDAFINVVKNERTAENYLMKLRADIDKRYASKLNKELLSLVRQEETLATGTLSFEAWLKSLGEASKRDLQRDLTDALYQEQYPYLVRYYKLQAISSKIDREKAMTEAADFMKELEKRKISKEIIRNFKEILKGERETGNEMKPGNVERGTQAFDASRSPLAVTRVEGYSSLRLAFDRAFSKLPKDFTLKAWPAWALYAQYMILSQEMESKGLHEETLKLKDQVLSALAKTPAEKEYLATARKLYLLRRLFQLELTRSEYEELCGRHISPEELAAGLQTTDQRPQTKGKGLQSPVSSLQSVFAKAVEFYETAIIREERMFGNALARMTEQKQNRAVIVTGGFHTEGLKKLAQERNCSYLQITPRINEVTKRDHEIYLRSMLGSRDFETSQLPALLGATPMGERVQVTGQAQAQAWRSEIRDQAEGEISLRPVSDQPVLHAELDRSAFGQPSATVRSKERSELRTKSTPGAVRAEVREKQTVSGIIQKDVKTLTLADLLFLNKQDGISIRPGTTRIRKSFVMNIASEGVSYLIIDDSDWQGSVFIVRKYAQENAQGHVLGEAKLWRKGFGAEDIFFDVRWALEKSAEGWQEQHVRPEDLWFPKSIFDLTGQWFLWQFNREIRRLGGVNAKNKGETLTTQINSLFSTLMQFEGRYYYEKVSLRSDRPWGRMDFIDQNRKRILQLLRQSNDFDDAGKSLQVAGDISSIVREKITGGKLYALAVVSPTFRQVWGDNNDSLIRLTPTDVQILIKLPELVKELRRGQASKMPYEVVVGPLTYVGADRLGREDGSEGIGGNYLFAPEIKVQAARSEARADFEEMRKEVAPFKEPLDLDPTDIEYFLTMLSRHRAAATAPKKIGETFWPSAMLDGDQVKDHLNQIEYQELLAHVRTLGNKPRIDVRFNSMDGGLGTTVDRFRSNLLGAIEDASLNPAQDFRIELVQSKKNVVVKTSELKAKGEPRILLGAIVDEINSHKNDPTPFDPESRIDIYFFDAASREPLKNIFVTIGAKGTDLPFDITVNGKKMKVTVAEIKAHRLYQNRGAYRSASFRPLVNDESRPSYEAFLDLPYFQDVAFGVERPRTYRQLLSEDNLSTAEPQQFFMQKKLPNIRQVDGVEKYAGEKVGDLTSERTAPANHGQLGFHLVVTDILNLADKLIADSEKDHVTKLEVFQNGDNVSSTINHEMAQYVAAENIPMAIVTTDKAPVDRKGGQIGLEAKMNKDGGLEGVTIKSDGTLMIAPGAPVKVTILEKAEAQKSGDLYKFFPMGIDGKFGLPGRKQSFNTNVIIFNATLLAKLLKGLEQVLTRTELLRQLSPDNISESKPKVKNGPKFYQLGGAISSLVFNLNAIFTLADKNTEEGRAILQVYEDSMPKPEAKKAGSAQAEVAEAKSILKLINLNEGERSEFFAPIKESTDYALLRYMDFYEYDGRGWLDIKKAAKTDGWELPRFTLGEEDPTGKKTSDGEKTETFYKDTLNARDAFSGVTPVKLDLEVVRGKVLIPGARLEGKIVVASDFPEVFNISGSKDPVLAAYRHSGRLELANVDIFVSKEGKVEVKALTESATGVARSEAREEIAKKVAELQTVNGELTAIFVADPAPNAHKAPELRVKKAVLQGEIAQLRADQAKAAGERYDATFDSLLAEWREARNDYAVHQNEAEILGRDTKSKHPKFDEYKRLQTVRQQVADAERRLLTAGDQLASYQFRSVTVTKGDSHQTFRSEVREEIAAKEAEIQNVDRELTAIFVSDKGAVRAKSRVNALRLVAAVAGAFMLSAGTVLGELWTEIIGLRGSNVKVSASSTDERGMLEIFLEKTASLKPAVWSRSDAPASFVPVDGTSGSVGPILLMPSMNGVQGFLRSAMNHRTDILVPQIWEFSPNGSVTNLPASGPAILKFPATGAASIWTGLDTNRTEATGIGVHFNAPNAGRMWVILSKGPVQLIYPVDIEGNRKNQEIIFPTNGQQPDKIEFKVTATDPRAGDIRINEIFYEVPDGSRPIVGQPRSEARAAIRLTERRNAANELASLYGRVPLVVSIGDKEFVFDSHNNTKVMDAYYSSSGYSSSSKKTNFLKWMKRWLNWDYDILDQAAGILFGILKTQGISTDALRLDFMKKTAAIKHWGMRAANHSFDPETLVRIDNGEFRDDRYVIGYFVPGLADSTPVLEPTEYLAVYRNPAGERALVAFSSKNRHWRAFYESSMLEGQFDDLVAGLKAIARSEARNLADSGSWMVGSETLSPNHQSPITSKRAEAPKFSVASGAELQAMQRPDQFMAVLAQSAGFKYLPGFDNVETYAIGQAALKMDSGAELVFRRLSRSHFYEDDGPVSPFHFQFETKDFSINQSPGSDLPMNLSVFWKGEVEHPEHFRDIGVVGLAKPEANHFVIYAAEESVRALTKKFPATMQMGKELGRPVFVEWKAVPETFWKSQQGKDLLRRHAATRGDAQLENAKLGPIVFKDAKGRPDSDFLQQVEAAWERSSEGKKHTDIFVFLSKFLYRLSSVVSGNDWRMSGSQKLLDGISKSALYRWVVMRIAQDGPEEMEWLDHEINVFKTGETFLLGFLMGLLSEEVRQQLKANAQEDQSTAKESYPWKVDGEDEVGKGKHARSEAREQSREAQKFDLGLATAYLKMLDTLDFGRANPKLLNILSNQFPLSQMLWAGEDVARRFRSWSLPIDLAAVRKPDFSGFLVAKNGDVFALSKAGADMKRIFVARDSRTENVTEESDHSVLGAAAGWLVFGGLTGLVGGAIAGSQFEEIEVVGQRQRSYTDASMMAGKQLNDSLLRGGFVSFLSREDLARKVKSFQDNVALEIQKLTPAEAKARLDAKQYEQVLADLELLTLRGFEKELKSYADVVKDHSSVEGVMELLAGEWMGILMIDRARTERLNAIRDMIGTPTAAVAAKRNAEQLSEKINRVWNSIFSKEGKESQKELATFSDGTDGGAFGRAHDNLAFLETIAKRSKDLRARFETHYSSSYDDMSFDSHTVTLETNFGFWAPLFWAKRTYDRKVAAVKASAKNTLLEMSRNIVSQYPDLAVRLAPLQDSAMSAKRSEARGFVTLAEQAQGNGLSEAGVANIRSWAGEEYARVHEQLEAEFRAAGHDPKAWSKINDAWYTKVAVGTAGMRGTLGLGTNRISEYTIGSLMLAHALSVNDPAYTKIIEENYPEFGAKQLNRAVVIGGDSRYGSYDTKTKKPGKHIKLEALINAALGIKAYVYKSPVSTPQLAWSVHELDVESTDLLVSGSMNTASHNPRTDNGNKPYKLDGSQSTGVFSDLMKKHVPNAGVAALNALTYDGLNVLENLDEAFERALAKGDVRWVGGTDDDSYAGDAYHADELFVQRELQEAIHAINGVFDSANLDLKNAKIVISPLYGVSRHILKKIIKARGLSDEQIIWVEDEPDSDFPGVEGGKPNPEEPKARLAALRRAVEVNADLVLWTDPDADRPAVATKKDLKAKAVSVDDYVSFNGNQQLAILMDYLVRGLKELATTDSLADDATRTHLARRAAMIMANIGKTFAAFSIVSGDLAKIIARSAGMDVVETMVGFKYIGDQIELRSKTIQKLAGITETEWQGLSNLQKLELALQNSQAFIFGGEESLGALSSDGPHDKDALSGVMWFVEIMGRLRKDGLTLNDRLIEIYKEYGYFSERFPMLEKSKKYAGVEVSEADAMSIIKAETGPSIMSYFRSTPPKTIGGKKVIAVLDYGAQVAKDTDGNVLFDADSQSGFITAGTPGIPESFRKALGKIGMYSFRHKAVPGSASAGEKLPKEAFVRFILEDGSIVTPRPSGTEPKLKFYILGRGSYENKAAVDAWVEAAAKELDAIGDAIAKQRFPEKFAPVAPADDLAMDRVRSEVRNVLVAEGVIKPGETTSAPVLVFNAGSSTIKWQVIDMVTEKMIAKGKVDIGAGVGKAANHDEALVRILKELADRKINPVAVGHRVLHGGEAFKEPSLINEVVIAAIEKVSVLGPLHNPPNLMCIRAAQKAFPAVPHVAVFDTAFHQTMPRTSFLYSIPKRFYDELQIRRYGFHGTSHRYVMEEFAKSRGKRTEDVSVITVHLGNGASIAAIINGKSFKTTMGLTPLEGVTMGTRSGDIDAGAVLYMMEKEGLTTAQMNTLLNKESGLKGLSGGESDVMTLSKRADAGDADAIEALEIFIDRALEKIYGYAGFMEHLDAVILTGGVGENSNNYIQPRLLERLKKHFEKYQAEERPWIGPIKTNEELVIARDTMKVLSEAGLMSWAAEAVAVVADAATGPARAEARLQDKEAKRLALVAEANSLLAQAEADAVSGDPERERYASLVRGNGERKLQQAAEIELLLDVGVRSAVAEGDKTNLPWQVEVWKKDDEPVDASMVSSLMDQRQFGRIVQGGIWRAYSAMVHGRNDAEKAAGDVALKAIIGSVNQHPFHRDVLAYIKFNEDQFGAMGSYLAKAPYYFEISNLSLMRMFMDYSRFDDVRRLLISLAGRILTPNSKARAAARQELMDVNAVRAQHHNFPAFQSSSVRSEARLQDKEAKRLALMAEAQALFAQAEADASSGNSERERYAPLIQGNGERLLGKAAALESELDAGVRSSARSENRSVDGSASGGEARDVKEPIEPQRPILERWGRVLGLAVPVLAVFALFMVNLRPRLEVMGRYRATAAELARVEEKYFKLHYEWLTEERDFYKIEGEICMPETNDYQTKWKLLGFLGAVAENARENEDDARRAREALERIANGKSVFYRHQSPDPEITARARRILKQILENEMSTQGSAPSAQDMDSARFEARSVTVRNEAEVSLADKAAAEARVGDKEVQHDSVLAPVSVRAEVRSKLQGLDEQALTRRVTAEDVERRYGISIGLVYLVGVAASTWFIWAFINSGPNQASSPVVKIAGVVLGLMCGILALPVFGMLGGGALIEFFAEKGYIPEKDVSMEFLNVQRPALKAFLASLREGDDDFYRQLVMLNGAFTTSSAYKNAVTHIHKIFRRWLMARGFQMPKEEKERESVGRYLDVVVSELAVELKAPERKSAAEYLPYELQEGRFNGRVNRLLESYNEAEKIQLMKALNELLQLLAGFEGRYYYQLKHWRANKPFRGLAIQSYQQRIVELLASARDHQEVTQNIRIAIAIASEVKEKTVGDKLYVLPIQARDGSTWVSANPDLYNGFFQQADQPPTGISPGPDDVVIRLDIAKLVQDVRALRVAEKQPEISVGPLVFLDTDSQGREDNDGSEGMGVESEIFSVEVKVIESSRSEARSVTVRSEAEGSSANKAAEVRGTKIADREVGLVVQDILRQKIDGTGGFGTSATTRWFSATKQSKSSDTANVNKAFGAVLAQWVEEAGPRLTQSQKGLAAEGLRQILTWAPHSPVPGASSEMYYLISRSEARVNREMLERMVWSDVSVIKKIPFDRIRGDLPLSLDTAKSIAILEASRLGKVGDTTRANESITSQTVQQLVDDLAVLLGVVESETPEGKATVRAEAPWEDNRPPSVALRHGTDRLKVATAQLAMTRGAGSTEKTKSRSEVRALAVASILRPQFVEPETRSLSRILEDDETNIIGIVNSAKMAVGEVFKISVMKAAAAKKYAEKLIALVTGRSEGQLSEKAVAEAIKKAQGALGVGQKTTLTASDVLALSSVLVSQDLEVAAAMRKAYSQATILAVVRNSAQRTFINGLNLRLKAAGLGEVIPVDEQDQAGFKAQVEKVRKAHGAVQVTAMLYGELVPELLKEYNLVNVTPRMLKGFLNAMGSLVEKLVSDLAAAFATAKSA
jgi:acetate kinase